jgi:NADH-quinone oxidoreductase subunit D
MFANQAFCLAAERLAGIEVTRRGEFCRVIACELNRIASHLISVGTFGQDIGAMTPFVHALRERETINNLMEEICGARLTYNYIRIGGVGYDILPETCTRIEHFYITSNRSSTNSIGCFRGTRFSSSASPAWRW